MNNPLYPHHYYSAARTNTRVQPPPRRHPFYLAISVLAGYLVSDYRGSCICFCLIWCSVLPISFFSPPSPHLQSRLMIYSHWLTQRVGWVHGQLFGSTSVRVTGVSKVFDLFLGNYFFVFQARQSFLISFMMGAILNLSSADAYRI